MENVNENTNTPTTKDEQMPLQFFDSWRTNKVYFTADLHLGHERIIDLCDRPFRTGGEPDVAAMNEAIVDGINSRVSGRDSLVILGDVVMGKLDENLKLLKGIRAKRIWIIPGNHDRFSLAYGHRGAVETQRTKRHLWKTQYEGVRAGIRCEADLFPSAWGGHLAQRRVLFSHYPYVGDSHSEEDRYLRHRPVDRGLPLIHGHVHGQWRENGRMLNVGVDVWGFKPVAEHEIVEWLANAPMGMGMPERVS
jgi:calcineurin-like phosphoesterase family protein